MGRGSRRKIASFYHRFCAKVISLNRPEETEVRMEKRVYLVAFRPLVEEECVNIYGFDMSYQKELEGKLWES